MGTPVKVAACGCDCVDTVGSTVSLCVYVPFCLQGAQPVISLGELRSFPGDGERKGGPREVPRWVLNTDGSRVEA